VIFTLAVIALDISETVAVIRGIGLNYPIWVNSRKVRPISFFRSLIGLGPGLILLVVVGALALASDILIMSRPDAVGIRSSALAWPLLGLGPLAVLVMRATVVACFGAILDPAAAE
jgi:hypothetical protein